MQTMPGPPRRRKRLARALGLDGNPLRRASDRAEAWIRAGLIAVFMIAGPLAALGVGGWAYHAGATVARVQAAPAYHVKSRRARDDCHPCRPAQVRRRQLGGGTAPKVPPPPLVPVRCWPR